MTLGRAQEPGPDFDIMLARCQRYPADQVPTTPPVLRTDLTVGRVRHAGRSVRIHQVRAYQPRFATGASTGMEGPDDASGRLHAVDEPEAHDLAWRSTGPGSTPHAARTRRGDRGHHRRLSPLSLTT